MQQGVLEDLGRATARLADLIVDEGQDLSLGFFRIARFVAQNITVFADENQQLRVFNTYYAQLAPAFDTKEQGFIGAAVWWTRR